jgi:hypothetical protein
VGPILMQAEWCANIDDDAVAAMNACFQRGRTSSDALGDRLLSEPPVEARANDVPSG